MDTAGVSGPVGSGSWLSYEKLCPIAIAYCTIMMAVWIPIEISNSYTIHGSGMMFSLIAYSGEIFVEKMFTLILPFHS